MHALIAWVDDSERLDHSGNGLSRSLDPDQRLCQLPPAPPHWLWSGEMDHGHEHCCTINNGATKKNKCALVKLADAEEHDWMDSWDFGLCITASYKRQKIRGRRTNVHQVHALLNMHLTVRLRTWLKQAVAAGGDQKGFT